VREDKGRGAWEDKGRGAWEDKGTLPKGSRFYAGTILGTKTSKVIKVTPLIT